MPNEKYEKYDNHTLSDYRNCPREWFHRHHQGLVPKGKGVSPALAFGNIVHVGMDSLYADGNVLKAIESTLTAFNENPYEDERRTPIRAAELIEEYWSYWGERMEDYELVAAEQYFEFPILWSSEDNNGDLLFSTEPEPEWNEIKYCGLIDKVLKRQEQGDIIGMDHKTTSFMSMPYLQAMRLRAQFMGYYYWLKHHSPWADDVSHLFYADFILTAKNSKYGMDKNVPLRRETVHATPDVVDEWLDDTRAWIIRLKQDEHSWQSHKQYPPKNTDNCNRYSSLCPYFDLCSHPAKMRETHIEMMYEEDYWDPQLIGA